MPLRRRPPEPSPRLRALLERAGANDAGGGTGLWQPERAWIASTPGPATDAHAQNAAASLKARLGGSPFAVADEPATR